MDVNSVINSIIKDAKLGVRRAVHDKVNKLIDSDAMLGKNWSAISNACLSVGEINLGIAAAKRFANVDNTLASHIQYAGLLAQVGRVNEALKCLESVPANKQDFSFLHLQGVCFSQIGQNEQANVSFNKALIMHPLSGPTWLSLVAVNRDEETIERLLKVKDQILSTDKHNVTQFLFALSKAYENNNQINQAIEFATLAGDNIKPQVEASGYKIEFEQKQVEALIQNQSDMFFSSFPQSSLKTDFTPIFILGLPRSGTTLLSQVLAAHSGITDGQELNLCRQAISPANLYAVESDKTKNIALEQKQKLIDHFSSEYTTLLNEKLINKKAFVIDKTLDLSRYAGLLVKAFPQAKFINLTRNKVDNAWSTYKNFFNQGLMWSYTAADIETFFNAETSLVKHWSTKLGDSFINIEYEQFVQSPETELKKLCEFIGIEFEADMVNYQHNDSVVQTVSVSQVREGISQDYVGVEDEVKQLFNDVIFL